MKRSLHSYASTLLATATLLLALTSQNLLAQCNTAGTTFGGDTGTAESPFQISSIAHLNNIRDNSGDVSPGCNYLEKHFVLTKNLDFLDTDGSGADYVYSDNAEGWLPIGHDTDAVSNGYQGTPFTGSFDGDDYVILNLRIDRGGENYVGLFGYVDGGSIVSLGLEDLEVTGNGWVGGLVGRLYIDGTVTGSYATGSVMGGNSVGGLVGSSNRGTVTGSYATGSVMGGNFVGGLVGGVFNRGTVTDSYATGSVVGGGSVGGLVGLSYNTVTASYATGSVTGQVTVGGLVGSNRGTVTASYATGSATGRDNVGGLVGWNNDTVTGSYATGSVTGDQRVGGLVGWNNDTVTHSYATGSVTGGSNVGGLVGEMDSTGTVTGSYWNTQLSGNATSSGGVGLTTARMYDQDSFVGFDFAGTPPSGDNPEVLSVWKLPVLGVSFPHLRGVSKNGQVLSVPHVGVFSGSGPFLLKHTFLPPTIFGQTPAFSGDDDAVATIDASGMITLTPGVTIGAEMTITVRRGGNDDYGSISVSQTLAVIPFGGGTGIATSPWQIDTPAQLNAIRDNTGASGENYLDDHFLLTTDLDFSGYIYDSAKGWLPIGHDTNAGSSLRQGTGFTGPPAGPTAHKGTPFTGSFDGDDHVILNLRIDRGGENYVGLFGYVDGGLIVSLGLEDLEVTGGERVGGLAGYSDEGTVMASYATGGVTGDERVGSLVGENDGTVTASYATGRVKGASNVGGLVGLNAGMVTGSYATGSVTGGEYVGGLVGLNAGMVTGSYATGSVTGDERVGGLVGDRGFSMVTDSYWNTDLSGNADSDGGVGLTTDEMFIQGSFAGFDFDDGDSVDEVADVWLPPMDGEHFPHLREVSKNGQILSVPRVRVIPGSAPFLLVHTFLPPMISGQTPAFSGDNDEVATINASTGNITLDGGVIGGEAVTITVQRNGNEDYAPISVSQTLMVIPFEGGTGTSTNPWQISTLAHLNAIRGEYLGGHFMLTTDLDFSEYTYDDSEKGWLPIGHDTNAGSAFHLGRGFTITPVGSAPHQGTRFTGSFAGDDHVIRNLRIDRGGENYVGLFGYVDGGSIVSLGLEDLEVTGDERVGGLVGENGGTVTGSYATGSVTGGERVGGLVGENDGTVTASYATVSVAGDDNNVGGLVGLNNKTVTDSYATGSVTGDEFVGGLVGALAAFGGNVTGSYATGTVTGDDNVGGLVGDRAFSTVRDSYWNTELSGNATSSGGVGLTTAQMYDQGRFGGFDFDDDDGTDEVTDVWLPPMDGKHFPHLREVSKNGQVLSIPRIKVILGLGPFSLVPTFFPPTITEAPVFSSDPDAVATIHPSSGEITLDLGAARGDEVTITVRRGGDSIYSSVIGSQVLQVTMAQTVTISEGSTLSKAFGDLPFTLTAIADTTSGLSDFTWVSSNSGVVTVTGGSTATVTVMLVGVGMTTLTVQEPGDEEWEQGEATVTLTVTKGMQLVSVTPGPSLTRTFGTDTSLNLTATGDAGSGLVSFVWSSGMESVATVSSAGEVTIMGAGVSVITVQEPGDGDWESGEATVTLTVSKGAPQISGFPESREVPLLPATFALGGTSSSGVPVTYSVPNTDVITISGDMATITGSGIVVVTATVSATANWEGVTRQQTLTVADKMGQTLTFASLPDKSFGDLPFSLSATSSEPSLTGSITFSSSDESVATVADSTVTLVGAGMTDIRATQAGSAEFVAASVVQTLTVTKGTQAPLGGESLTKAFGDLPFTLTAVSDATSGLSAFEWESSDTGVATVPGGSMATATVTLVGVGMTTLTAREPGNLNWKEGMTQWILTVSKGVPQISGFPENREVSLVPATFALGGTSSSGAPVTYSVPNTDVITISGGMATITSSGIVVVTATVSATANWEGVTRQQTLTVADKMGQTLTFAPLPDKSVGDSPFPLSATSSEPSLTSSITFSSSEESVATVAGFTVTVVGSGMTDIRATQAGNAEFVAASVVQTLTVTKGTQTPSGGMPLSKAFGDSEFTLTAVSDVTSGLSAFEWVSSDTGVATVPAGPMATVTVTLEGVGMTTLTAREPGNEDWEEGMTEWTLTVTKGTQTPSGGMPLSKTFGDSEFMLTAVSDITSGLSAFEWVSSDTGVATVPVGPMATVTVTLEGAGMTTLTAREPGNEDWEEGTTEWTLTVLKGASQISGFPESREVPLVPATFALGGTSSSGETITYSVPNTDVITISGDMATITDQGTVEVTATVLATANWEGVTQRQALTVADKMGQILTFAPLPDKRVGDLPFPLSATSSESSLTSSITFSSSDESVATVMGSTVTVVGSGMTDITATQAGSAEFVAASVVQTLHVFLPVLTFGSEMIPSRNYLQGTLITPLSLPEATGGTGPYTYTLDPVPAGLSFDADPASRTLSGTPDATQALTEHTYTVTDSAEPVQTATLTFTITVLEAGTLTFMSPVEAQTYTKDVEIEPLTLPEAIGGMGPYTYTLVPEPAGLSFDDDPASRTLSGTPDATQALTEYTYTVTDSAEPAQTATLTFTITVIEVGTLTFMPPSVEAQTYTKDTAITPLTLPEAMGGTGPYTYTLTPVPAGLMFDDDPASRTLSGTPDATQALTGHTYTVTDSATGTSLTASLTFTITVIEALGIGSQEAAVHVYPNPASDVLHIEFPGADEYGIALLTLTGKPVFGGWHAGGGFKTLDVSTLKRGVYLLKIEDSEGVLHIFRIIR